MKLSGNVHSKGFTIIEVIVVVAIIAIGTAIGFWSLQKRQTHYRLRGESRRVLGLMKLAQASAIRANGAYRIVRTSTKSFNFQYSPSGGNFGAVPTTETKLAQVVTLDAPIVFTSQSGGGCTLVSSCFTPQFRADGTLNTAGSYRLTDTKESLTVTWTIGGSVRIQ